MCERLYIAAMLVTHLWPHTGLRKPTNFSYMTRDVSDFVKCDTIFYIEIALYLRKLYIQLYSPFGRIKIKYKHSQTHNKKHTT